MGELMSAVVAYCEDADLAYRPVAGASVLELGFHGEHAHFQCAAIADEETQRFIFLARYPVPVPPDRRGAVMEWVSRANCGLAVGNFEMDPDDGDVRFRTSVDVEGLGLPGVLVRNVIAPAVATADRLFPAFALVVYAGAEPKHVLEILRRPPGEAN